MIGMSLNDFWSSTPREFFNRLNGFLKSRKQDIEIKQEAIKQEWKIAQYLAWQIHINNPYVKTHIKTLEEFCGEIKKSDETNAVVEIKSKEQLYKFFNIQE